MVINNKCNGNCNQGRMCDCAQEFSDSELGIEPPPKQSSWFMGILYVGTAVAVVTTVLLIAGVR